VDVLSDYCGLRLSSEVPLPELQDSDASNSADLKILEADRGISTRQSWTHHWLNGSQTVLSLAKVNGRHVLQFDDGALFDFDRETRTVRFSAPLSATDRHHLLDHVLPRVLDDLGHVMMHGSAINSANGAIMFIGDSGQGKSSLAASFQNIGIDVLSDDCMRLYLDADKGVSGVPTYSSLRLWPDSAAQLAPGAEFEPMSPDSDKRRIDTGIAPPGAPSPLAAICVLVAPGGSPARTTFSSVAPARAVSLLLAQCFRLDPTDRAATARTFERCADVVERVPIVEFTYPRDYSELPAIRDAVLRRAADGDWDQLTSR
jgi:hypothetical protein